METYPEDLAHENDDCSVICEWGVAMLGFMFGNRENLQKSQKNRKLGVDFPIEV